MSDSRIQRRQLVFQPMSGPVLMAAHSGESLMAEHAGPHDVGAGVVVVGVGQHARRLGADGVHERQVQVVSHGHRAHVVEEALKQVAEHVGEAGGRLEGRQREGELGFMKANFGRWALLA